MSAKKLWLPFLYGIPYRNGHSKAEEVAPSKAEEVKKLLVEASARMEKEAYRAFEDEFSAVAKPEDLRKEDTEMYENVRDEGLSVCGRCR